jgi:hypothetical protein
VFRWSNSGLASMKPNASFTGTSSYEEAVDLMKHGWDAGAEKLNKLVNAAKNVTVEDKKRKQEYNVAGFQCSVPRYLQGVPTSMINQKTVVVKKKVVTVVKNINYNGYVSATQIMEESKKAVQVVMQLEAQGLKVNLDIIAVSVVMEQTMVFRIRIKSAGERVNISKLAFPLAHPSMLRRFEFRHTEVHPEITSKSWLGGYGRAISEDDAVKKFLDEGDLLLGAFIPSAETAIKGWNM